MSEIAISIVLVLVFFFAPLIFSIKALKRTKKIIHLEEEVKLLTNEIRDLKEGFRGSMTVDPGVREEPNIEIMVSETDEQLIEQASQPESAVIGDLIVRPSKRKFNFKWKWNQERFFAFLGACLGIIGLVFFTLYMGNRIGILVRFMIMTGFSIALLLISFPLGKKEKWDELSHISRSFSGALFLFAVFASTSIEGLKWLESPLLALALIGTGIVYNFVLGRLCRKKGYIVFHMVINFLVIFLLPYGHLVFALAFILTMSLQIFSFLSKEEINTSLSFFLFSLYCLFVKDKSPEFSYIFWSFNFMALVSFLNLLRNKNQNKKLYSIISYGHPILWIALTAILSENKVIAVIPPAVGILVGVLMRSRETGFLKSLLYWPLQILVAGLFLILASGSGTQYWLTVLYIESAFFSYGMIKETDNKIIPLLLNSLILMGTVLYIFFSDDGILNFPMLVNRIGLISSASCFLMFTADKNKNDNSDYALVNSVFQFLMAILAVLLSLTIDQGTTIREILIFTTLILIIFFISKKEIMKLRTYGIWLVIVFSLFMVVKQFIDEPGASFYNNLFLILPLLFLSLITLIFTRLKSIQFSPDLGICLFSLILIINLFYPFWIISSILPGILFLTAAFVYLLLWQKSRIWEVHVSGLVFLLIFFIRHITHHLQMENMWYMINIRFVIELTAMSVFFLYMKSSRWRSTQKIPLLNRSLQGTVFALSWMFLLLMLLSHSNRNILSLVLQLSVVLLLIIEKRGYLPSYPLLFAAYIHFLSAQVNLAMNAHPSFPFLPAGLQNPWVFGFINLAMSIFVIYLFFRHIKNGSYDISRVFPKIEKITDLIVKKKNMTLLIPLFTSLVLFFYWTLDSTALTIALFTGCFLLYGTALVLRENVFRHATSLALLATSIRLIFWDLAQSTMLAKSIAFLGASVILINILYSQFKGRFENA